MRIGIHDVSSILTARRCSVAGRSRCSLGTTRLAAHQQDRVEQARALVCRTPFDSEAPPDSASPQLLASSSTSSSTSSAGCCYHRSPDGWLLANIDLVEAVQVVSGR